jgi:hypothetical protein
MISRLTIALPVAVLAAALCASSAPAQVHNMGASAPARRAGGSFGHGGRSRLVHPGHHQNFTGSGFLLPSYFYPDDYLGYDYDEESDRPQSPPVQVVVAPPAPPPVPAAGPPVESLLLEYRDGQWVRVPTGGQLPGRPQSVQPDSAQASSPRLGMPGGKETAQPLPAMPRAVLVFRDGHTEELESYMIQGDVVYARLDYWSSGSWTRKIPIAELDVPATVKLNEQRGGKFDLPSGPNEIMIRF